MNRAAKLFGVALLAGCASSDSTAPGVEAVAAVEITPGTDTVTPGGTTQLTAVTRSEEGAVLAGRAIDWTSSSEAVAIVSGMGRVVGLASGAVTITATSEGVSGTATVVVASPPPPPTGFVIRTPAIEISPRQEVTYCYHFRTPNTVPVAVRQWKSQLGEGALDMSVVLTSIETRSAGTVTTVDCGLVNNNLPITAYVTHEPVAEYTFPADDGSGRPLALIIPPNQPAHLRIHYRNPSPDQPISVTVESEAVGYPDGTDVTRADPFIAYNAALDIPARSAGSAVDTCATPTGARFFRMTTYSHKYSVHTFVEDGDAVVFESTDFARPGARVWPTAPFYSFATGRLTYQCDYVNPLSVNLLPGSSHQYEEECIVVAYYFPSTGPTFCRNGTLAPRAARVDGDRETSFAERH